MVKDGESFSCLVCILLLLEFWSDGMLFYLIEFHFLCSISFSTDGRGMWINSLFANRNEHGIQYQAKGVKLYLGRRKNNVKVLLLSIFIFLYRLSFNKK